MLPFHGQPVPSFASPLDWSSAPWIGPTGGVMRDSQRSASRPQRRAVRRGAAAVELAVLLPFLAFLFVIAVDWSRIFYYSMTVTNCARNGALWAGDPYTTTLRPYSNIT